MKVAVLKNNKWVRYTGVALLVLLGVWLLAWLAVPPILKSQLEKIASEKLGRQVSVGKVDFKPWTLELVLENLRIAGPGGGDVPQLQVRRIYVDAELQSVLRLAPVVDAVQVEAPHLHIVRGRDGRFDFDDILARLAREPEDPDKEPARFAIYNISLTEGAVDADDQTFGRKHELRGLTLSVPFLSNFVSKREVKVEPRLAFSLNGVSVDSSAQSTPFLETHKTDAQIHIAGFDLQPYLAYVPPQQPVKPRAGVLDADLRIGFEQGAAEGLRISGTMAAREVKLSDARGRDLLDFDALKVDLRNVRPLEGLVQLGDVTLSGPRVVAVRAANGRLNLLEAAETPTEAQPTRPVAEAAQRAVKKQEWRIQVDRFALDAGRFQWRDETLQPAAAVEAGQLEIQAAGISWPMDKPASFNGSFAVAGANLKFKGEATDKVATVETETADLPLSVAAPYLARTLVPRLDGKLGAQIDVLWNKPELKIRGKRVWADGLALAEGKTVLASAGRLELTDTQVDLVSHKLAIGGVRLNTPKLQVERDKEQRWMYERWIKPSPAQEAAVPPSAEARPWMMSIASATIEGGTVAFSDNAGPAPVAAEISDFKLGARNIVPGSSSAFGLDFSGRLGAGRSDPGRFGYKGKVALKPLKMEGQLDAHALPVHAFKAYYAQATPNVDLRRAYVSYKGRIQFAQEAGGMRLGVEGDGAVDDLRVNSALPASSAPSSSGLERDNQLLAWKTLALRGVQFHLAPNAPLSLDVGETSLTDFFARILIDETGRLRLQDYASRTPIEAAPAPAEAAAAGQAPAAAPTDPATAGPAPMIHFGPIVVVNGRIDFSDRFIKPNYTADLSELTGRLSAFSSQPGEGQQRLADLELRGKAQQTAALEILGKLNPLAKPLELDITAKMRDLELAPLSPYSARYAGHGIERGKLSATLNYKVQPDGKLTATNKLVLNQLTFGDEVAGAERTLPVRLAVVLLSDRNGVIDVDLPLSGSINDPQFRVGPLIWKGILNLIGKALTAPFSLLTGGLGGAEDSNTIVFAPGSAVLDASARESLDKLAKALVDRPALKMTIVGTASLERERDAYQRERLRQFTFAEKRRIANRAGKDVSQVEPVTDAEYPELLRAVYKRADISKPRNMVGLPKDLPIKEMEDLLMASVQVGDETMRQLAIARGTAVRDYLFEREIEGDRLFLGAVQTPSGDDKWKPGAELKLDIQ